VYTQVSLNPIYGLLNSPKKPHPGSATQNLSLSLVKRGMSVRTGRGFCFGATLEDLCIKGSRGSESDCICTLVRPRLLVIAFQLLRQDDAS